MMNDLVPKEDLPDGSDIVPAHDMPPTLKERAAPYAKAAAGGVKKGASQIFGAGYEVPVHAFSELAASTLALPVEALAALKTYSSVLTPEKPQYSATLGRTLPGRQQMQKDAEATYQKADKLRESLAYQPKTNAGKTLSALYDKGVEGVMSAPGKFFDWVDEKALNNYIKIKHPNIYAGTRNVLDAATMVLVGETIGKGVKAAKPYKGGTARPMPSGEELDIADMKISAKSRPRKEVEYEKQFEEAAQAQADEIADAKAEGRKANVKAQTPGAPSGMEVPPVPNVLGFGAADNHPYVPSGEIRPSAAVGTDRVTTETPQEGKNLGQFLTKDDLYNYALLQTGSPQGAARWMEKMGYPLPTIPEPSPTVLASVQAAKNATPQSSITKSTRSTVVKNSFEAYSHPDLETILTPEPPEPAMIRPAVKMGKSDKILIGPEGASHADIAKKAPEKNRIFVTPDDQRLTRTEASQWLKENHPAVYDKLPEDQKTALHSQGLWTALGKPFGNQRGFLDLSGAKELGVRIGNYLTIDPIPWLGRAGAQDSGIVHASARIAVPHIIKDLLAKVFPDSYRQPQVMAKTIDILNKDNVLGGYDSFMERAVDFTARAEYAERTGASTAAVELRREAKKWTEAAQKVATTHDLALYDTEVQMAKVDPEVAGNIGRWNQHVVPLLDSLYNEVKRMDPLTARESRGRYLDSRINLLSVDKQARWTGALKDAEQPMPEPSASSYRNPNVKHDAYDTMAHFTGEYSTDAESVLASVLGPRWNEVTKLRFYDDLVRKGIAVEVKPGSAFPMEGYTSMPIKLPETNDQGVTRQVERQIIVPKEAVAEIRGILNTDLPLGQNPVLKFLTGVQLFQVADLVTHTKNLISVISRAQGAGSIWADSARALHGIGTIDGMIRVGKVLNEIHADTPEIRTEMAEMAKKGYIRPEFPSTGVQKITRGQEIIHHVDTAVRILMNRFFDDLKRRGIAEGSEANRARMINQVGQYNRRLMGPIMRVASQIGLSPFIVAGRNFNRNGRWNLTGNPGIEAASLNAAVQMRVINLARNASLIGLPMILNTLTTGNVGGRPGTPIGAWDLGTDEKDGKHKIIDLLQFVGVRRGMRGMGIEALAEGIRTGKNANQIAKQAADDAINMAVHPWAGPGAAAIFTAVTGRRPDIRGVTGQPVGHKIPEGGIMQNMEWLRASIEAQNPFVYAMMRPAFEKAGLEVPSEHSVPYNTGAALLKSPAGAFGIKDVMPDETAAEKLAESLNRVHLDMTAAQYDKMKKLQSFAANLKSVLETGKGNDEYVASLKEEIQKGTFDKKDLAYIFDVAKDEKIQRLTRRLPLPDYLEVFGAATQKEKILMAGPDGKLLRQKISNFMKKATPEEIENLTIQIDKIASKE